jgi:hypothetical protein
MRARAGYSSFLKTLMAATQYQKESLDGQTHREKKARVRLNPNSVEGVPESSTQLK